MAMHNLGDRSPWSLIQIISRQFSNFPSLRQTRDEIGWSVDPLVPWSVGPLVDNNFDKVRDGRTDGQNDGRTDGRTERRSDGQTLFHKTVAKALHDQGFPMPHKFL